MKEDVDFLIRVHASGGETWLPFSQFVKCLEAAQVEAALTLNGNVGNLTEESPLVKALILCVESELETQLSPDVCLAIHRTVRKFTNV